MYQLDHVVLAAADLAEAKRTFADQTGCQPADGGSHVGLGTRNALASLGPTAYLEIIAPDPEQELAGTMGEFLSQLKESTLLHWAVRSDDLPSVSRQASELALTPTPVRDTSRAQPNGELLSWQLMGIGGHSLRGIMPFFIDWMDCPHPALHTPSAGELDEFNVSAPQGPIHAMLRDVEGVTVQVGEPKITMRFNSPQGPITYSASTLSGFRF